MPLHPKVEALLEAGRSAVAPTWPELGVEGARRAVEQLVTKDVEEVEEVEDRLVPMAAGDRHVRIYRPAEGELPVMVFFHGSGFVMCSIETHDGQCRALANRSGAIVVSVDYRLAPEHPFPAGLEDCYAATVWVYQHAADFGGDSTRLAIAGDSAGGNLAAATALMARDRGGPPIAFQLLVYPMLSARMDTPSVETNGQGNYGLA